MVATLISRWILAAIVATQTTGIFAQSTQDLDVEFPQNLQLGDSAETTLNVDSAQLARFYNAKVYYTPPAGSSGSEIVLPLVHNLPFGPKDAPIDPEIDYEAGLMNEHRICTSAWGPISERRSVSTKVDIEGEWKVRLGVSFWYGYSEEADGGYEYDGDETVCINAPFTIEESFTEEHTFIVGPKTDTEETPSTTSEAVEESEAAHNAPLIPSVTGASFRLASTPTTTTRDDPASSTTAPPKQLDSQPSPPSVPSGARSASFSSFGGLVIASLASTLLTISAIASL